MAEKLQEVDDLFWKTNINQFNRDITEEFLQQGHLSERTLEQYRSGLRQFFKWVHDYCSNKPIYELKPRDALKYQNYLIGRGLSSSAIKFKRSSVSSLCGYLEIYYLDEYPTFRNIYNKNIPSPPKAVKHEKKPLSKEELDHLVQVLEERKEWQMLAYVWFTYITGCRREESRQLLKEVVDYNYVKDQQGNVKNYYATHNIRAKGRGKEGKVRKFSFDDRAKDAIKKWLDVRGHDECPFVFVSKSKGEVKQVSDSAFNYWCSEIFSKIVGRRVHPHLFRSTRATHIVALEGKDIKSAQALLGHESSETTEIYVVRETQDELDDLF